MDCLVSARFEVEQRYEYDAPKFLDFEVCSTTSHDSVWFEAQEEVERVGDAAAMATEDGVATNAATSPTKGMAEDAAVKPPRKKNIVTSWCPEVDKKRKAKEGAPGQRPAKAAKQTGEDAPAQPTDAQPSPRTRSQHAKAAKTENRRKTAKEVHGKPIAVQKNTLKVMKMNFKAKSKSKAMLAKKARLSKVLQPLRIMPLRSTKELTLPQEVELRTSKRAKKYINKSGGDSAIKQVEQQKNGDCEDETDGGPESSPYKPLVLRVKEFDKTPGRFKQRPDQPLPPKPLTVTEPKEPQLMTTRRTRKSVFKPREVAEVEAMSQMPVFKASTLNPLILSTSGQVGVPKVDKREPTELQPFNFLTDDRAEVRAAKQQVVEVGPSGQHQPAAEPGKDRTQSKRKSMAIHSMEPVVPRSPRLLTKYRARESKVEEPRHEFHANPVPKYLSVPSLDLPHGHGEGAPAPTQPEPFKLATSERGAQHRAALAARLAAEEKAARSARIPRAHGLPLSTDMPLVPPKPESRALTLPEPFGLASEARHEMYQDQKRRALEMDEAAKRAEADFKARPMWRGIPFRVHDANLPLTVPEAVNLHTTTRAVTREAFNKVLDEKFKEAEVLAQLAKQEARMQEEDQRRQLRKAANFHARPMPDLSAPPAKPLAPKPPTKAVSPRLGRNARAGRSDK